MNKKLIEFVQSKKRITIAEFIEFALYDSLSGYYIHQDTIGSKGDFITAPEISQLFGEIISIWAIKSWESMKKPNRLAIVELGPGKGTLMDDFMRTAKSFPDFANACEFHLVEISDKLKTTQKKHLEKHNNIITWHASIKELSSIPTIFIGNEFLDALPINQFIMHDGMWHEVYLTIKDNALVYDYVRSPIQFEPLKNGTIFEKNLKAESVVRCVSEHIKTFSGSAILIDYGYTTPTGLSTLQAVKKHKFSNPFVDVGFSDITAHVDFSALLNIASQYANSFVTTQREFLSTFGIIERAEMLKRNSNPTEINKVLSRLLDDMHPLFKVLVIENYIKI